MGRNTPEAATVDPVPSETETPGLGKRLLARVLDAVIIGIPASALLAIMGLPAPTIGLGGTSAWLESAVTAGLWFAYYVAFEAVTGATVAKRIMNLKVVSATGGSAALTGAAMRNSWILFGLIPVVGGILLLVAVVWIAASIGRGEQNTGVHDRISGTAVIGTF